MVCLDGFSKIPDVSADNQKVLPNLPVFVVTLQGLLQGSKGFGSVSQEKKRNKKKGKPQGLSFT